MIQFDLGHPLAFHIQPYLNGEPRYDVVAALLPDQPGEVAEGWIAVWINPPHLGERPLFHNLTGEVYWEWVEHTPAPLRADWQEVANAEV